MGLANISIVGNVVRPPSQTAFTSGTTKTTLVVAVNDPYRKGDNPKDSAEFYRVEAWGKLGEVVHKYVGKGHQITAVGRFSIERWNDREGRERFTPTVHATQIHLPPKRGALDPSFEANDDPSAGASSGAVSAASSSGASSGAVSAAFSSGASSGAVSAGSSSGASSGAASAGACSAESGSSANGSGSSSGYTPGSDSSSGNGSASSSARGSLRTPATLATDVDKDLPFTEAEEDAATAAMFGEETVLTGSPMVLPADASAPPTHSNGPRTPSAAPSQAPPPTTNDIDDFDLILEAIANPAT